MCQPVKVRKDKGSRVLRFAAAAEQGRVNMLDGVWNSVYRNELVAFPEGQHDDQIDASSLAFNSLVPLVSSGPKFLYSGSYA